MTIQMFQKFRLLCASLLLVVFLLQSSFSFSAEAYSKVEFSPLELSGTSKDNSISLKWKHLDKGGVDFDGYNILHKNGQYKKLSSGSAYVGFVSANSFSFNNLILGDWWSFQVVPVKLVNNEYVAVAAGSKLIQIKVVDKKNKSKGESRSADGSSASGLKVYATSSEELAVPIIKTPANDKVLTQFPRNAYLSWDKVLGTKRYEIEFSCAGCDGGAEKWGKVVKYSTKKAHFLTSELSGDNHYRFRVRAVVRAGIMSEWSKYSYFSFDTSKSI